MKTNLHRLNQLKLTEDTDKSNIFIELNSPMWRIPSKISLEDLINGIKLTENIPEFSKEESENFIELEEKTLNIKVENPVLNTSNVHHEFLGTNKVSIYSPPKDVSAEVGLHLMSDSNYLYVWVGNRWKKVILCE